MGRWLEEAQQEGGRMKRGLAILLIFLSTEVLAGVPAGPAHPVPVVKHVTVNQLEQILKASHRDSDRKVSRELGDLQLSERLAGKQLLQLRAELPGGNSRRALELLADESAFLEPPAEEIPVREEPDFAAQQRMMAQTVDYLARILPQLPNFFATRTTSRFLENRPLASNLSQDDLSYMRLQRAGSVSETVLYRDGKEVVDTGKRKRMPYNPSAQMLTTRGVFGPILSLIIVDAAKSKFT
jgi:hypothetical protein